MVHILHIIGLSKDYHHINVLKKWKDELYSKLYLKKSILIRVVLKFFKMQVMQEVSVWTKKYWS
jgi:hypothetical protein